MPGNDAGNVAAAGVTPFGGGVSGLQIRLVRAPAGRFPFVVLHEGRHSRVLLGEVVAGNAVLARFAWKLRADREPAAPGRGASNTEVDARWQRERELVATMRSPHIVAGLPLAPALLQAPPLWFCARTERWFLPVCPDTGAVLRVCRDDDVLTQNGLPGYAVDGERYLHGGVAGAPRTFYQLEPAASRRPGVAVRGRDELVAGFGVLVHAPAGDARTTLAAPVLPCLACAHRRECFPPGVEPAALPAQQELHAVSFFDVDAVVTELQPFDFDEACTLLGGGDLGEILAARTGLGREAGIAPAVGDGLRGPEQWLFADDPVRWSVEIALRKVTAFLQLLDGLQAVHTLGRPHLGLAPGNVLANWHAGAPGRWGLQFALNDLGSASVKALPTPGGEQWFEPGAEMLEDLRCRAYIAPALRVEDGQSLSLAVTCYRTGEADGRVRFVVEGQGNGVPRSARPGDIVMVQTSRGGAALVGRLEEARAGGLLLAAALPEGHPCLQWDGTAFEARVVFHRRLGRGADCHGLGALLLRCLLVDDEQGIDEVFEAFGRCLRWLEDTPVAAQSEPQRLVAQLQQWFAGREVPVRLQPVRLLHRRADRDAYELALAAGATPFDGAVWCRLLAVACRLLTFGSPSSFAQGLGDDDATLVARIRDELGVVQRRLHVELFDAAARDAMVAARAAQWLAQRVPAEVEAAVAAPIGFTLHVAHETGEPVTTAAFAVDRVSIGRRDDNALQLADPMVSSAHAAIERSEGTWVAVDLASTNGTEVDGIRLPVEVPQPLQDGSVIGIRPFVLTFRLPQQEPGVLFATEAIAEAPLREQLHAAWAAATATALAREQALDAVLQQAEMALGSVAVAARLRELQRPHPPAAAVSPAGDGIAAAAAHGLAQLSRALLGAGEFHSAQDAQTFAAKLARYVEASTQGVERLLALRKALGRHLDLGLVTTQQGVPSLRSAATVRDAVLGWESGSLPIEAAGTFVARFYDDILAILSGLLRGNQQARRAVRERLDPAKLVETAGREAKLALLVQVAANSALWKLYVQAFLEVTGNEQYERDLEQLLQQALPTIRAPGTVDA